MCVVVQRCPIWQHRKPDRVRQILLVFACLFGWIAVLGAPVAQAASGLVSTDTHEKSLNLQPVLQYWMDPTGTTDPNTVLHSADALDWTLVDGPTPSFGFDKSAYWYRFGIDNPTDTTDDLVLEIDYPVLDYVDVYLQNADTSWALHRFGDKIPFSARTVKHHNFILPLTAEARSVRQVLIRVQTNGAHQVPLQVWKRYPFEEHNQNQLVGQGIYFGVMMVMVLYNLFIFFSVRDSSYIFYVGTVASFSMFQAGLHGFAFEYFWPNAVHWNDTAISVEIGLFGFFGSMSVLTFLRLKEYNRFFYRLLVGYAAASVVCVFLSFVLPYDISVRLNTVLGAPGHLVCLAPGIYMMLKGHWHARFFVIGWSLFLCSTLMLTLNKFGLLPVNFMTEYTPQLGSMAEVVLFSFALADRINFYRQEHDRRERQHQLALMEANRSLEESNRVKDEFLATISHELRTPMNGVIGCLDNMQGDAGGASGESYRSAARQSARDMMRLVERILGYTEVQSGQLVLRSHEFSLQGRCKALAEEYQQRATGKGLAFSLDIGRIPDTLIGDETHIVQVLDALLDNAFKFTRQGSIGLRIVAEDVNEKTEMCTLRFTVSDSGDGIPASARDTLFDKFNQLDRSYHRSFGGLGIGLATSQALVKAMGGCIDYAPCTDAGQEGGSVFSFCLRLPCKVSVIALAQREVQPATGLDLHGKHVLVVEDNPVNQMVIKGKLKKQGADVVVADNGQIAVDLIQQQLIDVVLMDCQMPVMDGFEATRCIRQLGGNYARVPIIAVTANAMTKDRQRCLDAGMNDYLSKPVDSNQLLDAIRKWVEPPALNKAQPPLRDAVKKA